MSDMDLCSYKDMKRKNELAEKFTDLQLTKLNNIADSIVSDWEDPVESCMFVSADGGYQGFG